MNLRVRVEVEGKAVYIGRMGVNWIVSDQDNTENPTAAVLETDGTSFGIMDSIKEFEKFKESYAHIESGECDQLPGQ